MPLEKTETEMFTDVEIFFVPQYITHYIAVLLSLPRSNVRRHTRTLLTGVGCNSERAAASTPSIALWTGEEAPQKIANRPTFKIFATIAFHKARLLQLISWNATGFYVIHRCPWTFYYFSEFLNRNRTHELRKLASQFTMKSKLILRTIKLNQLEILLQSVYNQINRCWVLSLPGRMRGLETAIWDRWLRTVRDS